MKLSDRDRQLLKAIKIGPILDQYWSKSYYIVGGHGNVDVRYDARTLPRLARAGMVERVDGSYRLVISK